MLARLDDGGAVVEEQVATRKGLAVGDTVKVTAANGHKAKVEVIGLYRDPMMFDGVIVSPNNRNG